MFAKILADQNGFIKEIKNFYDPQIVVLAVVSKNDAGFNVELAKFDSNFLGIKSNYSDYDPLVKGETNFTISNYVDWYLIKDGNEKDAFLPSYNFEFNRSKKKSEDREGNENNTKFLLPESFNRNKELYNSYKEYIKESSKGTSINETLKEEIEEEIEKSIKQTLQGADKLGRYKIRIFVVPKEYVIKEGDKIRFTGALNESLSKFSSDIKAKTTDGGRFISTDDAAFTINQEQNLKKLLKNLGIEEAFKVGFPFAPIFSGIGVNFFAIPTSEDQNVAITSGGLNKGVLSFIYNFYKNIMDLPSTLANSHVIFIGRVKTKAKVEIKFYYDIPYQFMRVFYNNIKKMGLEDKIKNESYLLEGVISSIEKLEGGKKRRIYDYNEYAYILDIILKGEDYKTHNDYLLNRFNQFAQLEKMNYLKGLRSKSKNASENMKKFLENSFVILKLTRGYNFKLGFLEKVDTMEEVRKNETQIDKDLNYLSEGERYAYAVGKIVGNFLKFKKKLYEQNGETLPNNTYDILSYPQYTKKELERAIKLVGEGIGLDLVKYEKFADLIKEISSEVSNMPKIKLADDEEDKDYSYFYYVGVFKTMG